MSQLIVYLESDEFIVKHIDEFNESTTKKFLSEDGLHEGIKAYQLIADQLDLKIQQGVTLKNGEALLWRVVNSLFDENGIVTHGTTVQTFVPM